MARDLNQCQFIGHAGSDAELRKMPNGNSVANVSIAVGDDYTDKDGKKVEQTEWVRLSAFGKLADIFGQYVTKGKQIYVSGKYKTDEYADKNTGEKKYSTQVVVSNMQLLGGKDGGSGAQPAPQKSQQGAPPVGQEFDDDIPFHPYMHREYV